MPDGSILTAITRIEDRLVEVIDVEKMLAEIAPYNVKVSQNACDSAAGQGPRSRGVLLMDDSSTAIGQLRDTLVQLDLKFPRRHRRLQALRKLKAWADEGVVLTESC